MRLWPLIVVAFAAALVAAGCGGPKDGALERANEEAGHTETTELETATGTSTTRTTDAPPGVSDEGAHEGGAEGTAKTVQIDVKPGTLDFVKEEIELKAGTYTFTSKNPDAVPHNIAVKEDGDGGLKEEGELVTDGDVSKVENVKLEAGKTYTFYCSPHEAAGMKGTIKVV